jgi:hypothetical protein
MEVKRLPLARPEDPFCQGLIERQLRRDRCITCRGCREWRLEYVPARAGVGTAGAGLTCAPYRP